MKKIVFSLTIFTMLSSTAYNVDELPWIQEDDSNAALYAIPFLPVNPIILEAGVCDAEDTLRMKKLWPNATIYGFEPLPQHYTLSQKNTEHIQGFTLYPCALFDKIGTLTFYESKKIPGASSLLKDNFDHITIPNDINYDGVNYKDTPITVQCTTIDQWAHANNITKVDYVWLDTEGAELPILRHAPTILATVKVISIEANFKEFRKGMTLFQDLYEFLTQQGFVLKHIWGRPDWQGVAVFVNAKLIN